MDSVWFIRRIAAIFFLWNLKINYILETFLVLFLLLIKKDTPCDHKSSAIYSVYIILDLYYVERRRNIPQPPSPVSPSIYLQFRTYLLAQKDMQFFVILLNWFTLLEIYWVKSFRIIYFFLFIWKDRIFIELALILNDKKSKFYYMFNVSIIAIV